MKSENININLKNKKELEEFYNKEKELLKYYIENNSKTTPTLQKKPLDIEIVETIHKLNLDDNLLRISFINSNNGIKIKYKISTYFDNNRKITIKNVKLLKGKSKIEINFYKLKENLEKNIEEILKERNIYKFFPFYIKFIPELAQIQENLNNKLSLLKNDKLLEEVKKEVLKVIDNIPNKVITLEDLPHTKRNEISKIIEKKIINNLKEQNLKKTLLENIKDIKEIKLLDKEHNNLYEMAKQKQKELLKEKNIKLYKEKRNNYNKDNRLVGLNNEFILEIDKFEKNIPQDIIKTLENIISNYENNVNMLDGNEYYTSLKNNEEIVKKLKDFLKPYKVNLYFITDVYGKKNIKDLYLWKEELNKNLQQYQEYS